MPDGMPDWLADGIEFLFSAIPVSAMPLTGLVFVIALTMLALRAWNRR